MPLPSRKIEPGDSAPLMKRCKKCGVKKYHMEFSRHDGKPDGLWVYCKGCERARRQRVRKPTPKRVVLKEKKCSRCQFTKPVKQFHKLSGTADGLQYYCKACAKAYQRTRYKQVGRASTSHRKGTMANMYYQAHKKPREQLIAELQQGRVSPAPDSFVIPSDEFETISVAKGRAFMAELHGLVEIPNKDRTDAATKQEEN